MFSGHRSNDVLNPYLIDVGVRESTLPNNPFTSGALLPAKAFLSTANCPSHQWHQCPDVPPSNKRNCALYEHSFDRPPTNTLRSRKSPLLLLYPRSCTRRRLLHTEGARFPTRLHLLSDTMRSFSIHSNPVNLFSDHVRVHIPTTTALLPSIHRQNFGMPCCARQCEYRVWVAEAYHTHRCGGCRTLT